MIVLYFLLVLWLLSERDLNDAPIWILIFSIKKNPTDHYYYHHSLILILIHIIHIIKYLFSSSFFFFRFLFPSSFFSNLFFFFFFFPITLLSPPIQPPPYPPPVASSSMAIAQWTPSSSSLTRSTESLGLPRPPPSAPSRQPPSMMSIWQRRYQQQPKN